MATNGRFNKSLLLKVDTIKSGSIPRMPTLIKVTMLENETHTRLSSEVLIPYTEIVSTVQEVGPRILTALREEYPDQISADRFPVCGPASIILGHYLRETFGIPIQQHEDPKYTGPRIEFAIRDHHFPEEKRVTDQTSIVFHTGKDGPIVHVNAVFPFTSSFEEPFLVVQGSSCREEFERMLEKYGLYPHSENVAPLKDERLFFTDGSARERADCIWAQHRPDVVFRDGGFVGPSGIYRETPIKWGSPLVRVMRRIAGPQWQPPAVAA